MGSSDKQGMWAEEGVPQQVVTAAYEVDDETTEEILAFLEVNGVPKERVHADWNTWKGLYFTPPLDEKPWTREEYDKIKEMLALHPNTIQVDTSPGAGSEG